MKFTAEGHLTARERKYLPLAFDYCRKNGMVECKVNQKLFHFDFAAFKGYVQPLEGDVKTRFSWSPA